eukprot:tig00000142_g8652.t1
MPGFVSPAPAAGRNSAPSQCALASSLDAGEIITLALENTFRKAFVYTYTGQARRGDPRYFGCLRAFCEAAIAAYLHGFSLPALRLEISGNELSSGDDGVDSFIRLDDEECVARNGWILAVYAALRHERYRPHDARERGWSEPRLDDPAAQGLEYVVRDVARARREGVPLAELLADVGKLCLPGETWGALPRQAQTLRIQNAHVVWLTLDAIGAPGTPLPEQ